MVKNDEQCSKLNSPIYCLFVQDCSAHHIFLFSVKIYNFVKLYNGLVAINSSDGFINVAALFLTNNFPNLVRMFNWNLNLKVAY